MFLVFFKWALHIYDIQYPCEPINIFSFNPSFVIIYIFIVISSGYQLVKIHVATSTILEKRTFMEKLT